MMHIQAGCVAAAMLAATGPACAATETVVYSFKGGDDGAKPGAGLINVGGTLYGTTLSGGGLEKCSVSAPRDGCGTVFSVTPTGAETIVYSFIGGKHRAGAGGAMPSGLIEVGGVLYGTTSSFGGSANCSGGCGTVFSVTPAGAETVVYSFTGEPDGAFPEAGLKDVKGNLYGTTFRGGGAGNFGTVFSVTPAGTESVVYSFKGGSDGANPETGLINLGGTMYGTTEYGGGSANCANGCGSVFAVTRAGAETLVYSFKGEPDGAHAAASLINVKGTLYGTTYEGGGVGNYGTVFSVTPAGAEKVLYSFKGGTDGASPEARLIDLGDALYGTTAEGGGAGCSGIGCGTVFKVTKAGAETVLYSFKGGNDGSTPFGGLIKVGGALYGVTIRGGRSDCDDAGCGTVFTVTP